MRDTAHGQWDVSVVIPTFNRAHLVGDAINSCLRQERDGMTIQVIVVDDCSVDGTTGVLASFGSRITTIALRENGGQARARNAGLPFVRGRYLKFLDSDDVLEEGALIEEMRLADRANADMVVTGHRSGNREFAPCVYERMERPDAILGGRAEPTSAVLYRTRYVSGLRWDETLSKLDDWYWFVMAALREGRIERLERLSYEMRDHGGERATSQSTMLENAREHHRILDSMEREIDGRGALTRARRLRLAQYYYKELRVLCLHDRPAFEHACRHILELDPDFVPIDEERQWYMRMLARFIGFRLGVRAHCRLKTLIKGRAARV